MASSGKTSFPPPEDAADLGFSGLLRFAMDHGLGKWPTSPGIAESWTRKDLAFGIEKVLRRKTRGEVEDKFGMVKSWLDDGRVPRAENLSALVLTLTDSERIAHATEWREAFLAARHRTGRRKRSPAALPTPDTALPDLETDDCARSLHDIVLRLLGFAPRLQDWPGLSRHALLMRFETRRFAVPELRELGSPRVLLLRLMMRAVRAALAELSLGDPAALQDRRSLFDRHGQASLIPLLAPMAAGVEGPDLARPHLLDWSALLTALGGHDDLLIETSILPGLIAEAWAREWARHAQVYWSALAPIWQDHPDKAAIEAQLALLAHRGRIIQRLRGPLFHDASAPLISLPDLALDLPCQDGGRLSDHLDAVLAHGWGGTALSDRLALLSGGIGAGKTASLHLLADRVLRGAETQDLAVILITPDRVNGDLGLPDAPPGLAQLSLPDLAHRAGYGRALILLDGLDRITEDAKAAALTSLRQLTTGLTALPCKVILSGSPASLAPVQASLGAPVHTLRLGGLVQPDGPDLRRDWVARLARFDRSIDPDQMIAALSEVGTVSNIPLFLSRLTLHTLCQPDAPRAVRVATLIDEIATRPHDPPGAWMDRTDTDLRGRVLAAWSGLERRDKVRPASPCFRDDSLDREIPADLTHHIVAEAILSDLSTYPDNPDYFIDLAAKFPLRADLVPALRDLAKDRPSPSPAQMALMRDALLARTGRQIGPALALWLGLEAAHPAGEISAILPILPLLAAADLPDGLAPLLTACLSHRSLGPHCLAGIDLAGGRWQDCDMTGSTLTRLALDSTHLTRCRGAEIVGSSLVDCDMDQAQNLTFARCDLTGARITDSQFQTVTWGHCTLDGLHLDRVRFVGVTFTHCDFSRVRLGDVHFDRCHFVGCDQPGPAKKSQAHDFVSEQSVTSHI